MSQPKPIQIMGSADPRWKDLYQLGGVAFIVWPYEPGFVPTADVIRWHKVSRPAPNYDRQVS